MLINPKAVIEDYRALRSLASKRRTELGESAITGHQMSILGAYVDNDPATEDRIVTSAFDLDFSSAAAELTFIERQAERGSVLEFQAAQPKSFSSFEIDRSSALIDLSSGALLSSNGSGNYLVGLEAPLETH